MAGPAKTVSLKIVADSAEAQRKLDDIYAKADELKRLNPTIAPKVDKAAAVAGLAVLRKELKDTQAQADKFTVAAGKLSTSAEDLGGSAASAGAGLGAMGGPMAGLLGAGVVLSPVIATLGVGLAGFGAAAVGVIKPIETAAQKAGGLSKNMKLLDPEQQAVARSLLGLGKQYSAFQNSLQPEVLTAFGTGLHLVSGLMRDVQPVAKATGTAVDGLLSRVDQEFRGGAWQGFFKFAAQTAAPDMKLLGDTLINLTDTLPPLLKDLQPAAQGLLELTAAATKGIDIAAQLSQKIGTVGGATKSTNPLLHDLGEAVKWNTLVTVPFVAGLIGTKRELDYVSGASDKSKQAMAGWATTGLAGALAAHGITAALNGMNTAVTTSIARVLTLEGDEVSWKQAQQAATQAINANHKALDGNSASALAARAAIVSSTVAVLKFADEQDTTTGSLHRASGAIQDQITWLERHAGKSRIARDEIHALREEEAKIKREIDQKIVMKGSGHYSISSFGTNPVNNPIGKLGAAAGMLIRAGTTPTADDVLIRASRGELVVPTHMVSAGAVDHLRGRIPGFAAGGLTGSYSGTVPGLTRFAGGMDKAFQTAMSASMVSAMRGSMKQVFTAGGAGGPGVARWAPMILQVLAMLGQSSANLGAVEHRMQQESGGNPYAINNWDSNAAAGDPSRGLMQTIGSTFERYRSWSLPDNIYNPEANIFAGLNYALNAYPGRSLSSVMLQAGGYDHGGYLPQGLSLAYNGTGKPEPVGAAAGTNITINVNVPPTVNPGDAGRQIADLLKQHIKRGGQLYPSGVKPR